MGSAVLAFDTCLGALSVAVGEADAGHPPRLLAEHTEALVAGHAERLLPVIERVMASAGVGFADVRRVAVTLGPGTFTGVRTGIAAARAMRLGTDIEVVGASSLAVMAHRVLEQHGRQCAGRPLLIAVDARRERLYAQLFASDAVTPLTGPLEMQPSEAAEMGGPAPLVVAGSGAAAVEAAARSAGRTIDVLAGTLEPQARDLLTLSAQLSPLRDISPVYLRLPDAKPQGDKRLRRTT